MSLSLISRKRSSCISLEFSIRNSTQKNPEIGEDDRIFEEEAKLSTSSSSVVVVISNPQTCHSMRLASLNSARLIHDILEEISQKELLRSPVSLSKFFQKKQVGSAEVGAKRDQLGSFGIYNKRESQSPSAVLHFVHSDR